MAGAGEGEIRACRKHHCVAGSWRVEVDRAVRQRAVRLHLLVGDRRSGGRVGGPPQRHHAGVEGGDERHDRDDQNGHRDQQLDDSEAALGCQAPTQRSLAPDDPEGRRRDAELDRVVQLISWFPGSESLMPRTRYRHVPGLSGRTADVEKVRI